MDPDRRKQHDVVVTSRLPSLRLAGAAIAVTLLVVACADDEPSPGILPGDRPAASQPAGPSQSPAPPPTSAPAPAPTATSPGSAPAEPAPTGATSSAPDDDGAPSTYEEALALFDQATGSQEFSRFASPSGNLYCVLDSPYLPPSCELGIGAIPDPVTCSADGPSQNVGRIEFTEVAPQPVCNTDTIREPGPPVLGYGAIASWPDTTVTCVMERVGVTCVNPPVGQGFFLAKGRYLIF